MRIGWCWHCCCNTPGMLMMLPVTWHQLSVLKNSMSGNFGITNLPIVILDNRSLPHTHSFFLSSSSFSGNTWEVMMRGRPKHGTDYAMMFGSSSSTPKPKPERIVVQGTSFCLQRSPWTSEDNHMEGALTMIVCHGLPWLCLFAANSMTLRLWKHFNSVTNYTHSFSMCIQNGRLGGAFHSKQEIQRMRET